MKNTILGWLWIIMGTFWAAVGFIEPTHHPFTFSIAGLHIAVGSIYFQLK